MAQVGNYLVRKLNGFMPLSEAELSCLSELQSHPVHIPRNQDLVHEGQSGHKAYILQAGWMCSFKTLPDGGRQIIGFPIPGDCVGLRSILLYTSDHSFSALTDITATSVDASHILQVFNEFPRLGAAILWAASRDEAMVVEHLVSVGRRSAIERTAYLFLELHERLELVGLTTHCEFACPLSQYVVADALGLSAIHVNRVLRQLRESDLMTFRAGKVRIHDIAALKRLAGFESQMVTSRKIGPQS